MLLGILAGAAVGAVLVAATVATGGLALVAAAGAAASLVSAGGLSGKYIGEASMGPACGKFVTGSPNVFVNGRAATFTFGSFANCSKDSGPQPLATGSSSVFINIGMAGREGEKVGCSAKSIAKVSPNVFIGGESAQDPRVTITPEVPEWAVTALQVLGIAGAVAALPFAIATVGVAATIGGALLGAASAFGGAAGGRALGEALGLSEAGTRSLEVAGGFLGGMVGGAAGTKAVQAGSRFVTAKSLPFAGASSTPASKLPFLPKKLGELEEGAVPTTSSLEAARDAAKLNTGRSQAGYPDLPDDAAQTFGPGVRPWDGDADPAMISRVVDADSNPSGSFWQRSLPNNEADWRGPSAVKNDWNGDGGYVQTESSGLKGWIGPAAPQDGSVPGYMLPGGGEQIWIPRGAAVPSPPKATPWNTGAGR